MVRRFLESCFRGFSRKVLVFVVLRGCGEASLFLIGYSHEQFFKICRDLTGG